MTSPPRVRTPSAAAASREDFERHRRETAAQFAATTAQTLQLSETVVKLDRVVTNVAVQVGRVSADQVAVARALARWKKVTKEHNDANIVNQTIIMRALGITPPGSDPSLPTPTKTLAGVSRRTGFTVASVVALFAIVPGVRSLIDMVGPLIAPALRLLGH
jgi:hypothetical protein